MKKIVLMIVIVTFMCSGSVMAAVTFTSAGSTGTTGIIASYKASTKVTLVATALTANYSAVSSHLNGQRVYGSGSNESVIYTLAAGKTAGDAYTTGQAADFAFGSDATLWKTL